MNILILGSGGREYSIGLAISKEDEKHNITFCPGNGATDKIGNNINIKDYNELASWAKNNNIELTIVGPEQPLVDGVVDIFKEEGLTIFGPSAKAAQLEGSKVYMKNILKKYRIDSVIHLAAALSVGESQKKPSKYKKINVQGTQNLLNAIKNTNVKNFIFSSTCAVY